MIESKTIEEKYKKLTDIEHVLQAPGMYIGSINLNNEEMWIFDDVINKITKKRINYVPGIYKIFDEILVNALDHSVKTKLVKS
jgi:DNA topoisomerase-2